MNAPSRPTPFLSAHDRRRVAVEAVVSDRTIRRFERDPATVTNLSATRIRRALSALGLSESTPTARELA